MPLVALHATGDSAQKSIGNAANQSYIVQKDESQQNNALSNTLSQAAQQTNHKDSQSKDSQEGNTASTIDSGNITQSAYLRGDSSILSQNAPSIVQQLSSTLEKAVGVQVFLYIVGETPQSQSSKSQDLGTSQDSQDDKDSKNSKPDSPQAITQEIIQASFDNRRAYEMNEVAQIEGQYAAIFLFYNDHAITLASNLDFLNEEARQQLLEDYAYPYLPADAVGSVRYDNGVNEGVSNLYLALMHTIAAHYNVTLDAPKPMEKPSDATKVIIYAMLLIMIGLFVIIRFGFGLKKKG